MNAVGAKGTGPATWTYITAKKTETLPIAAMEKVHMERRKILQTGLAGAAIYLSSGNYLLADRPSNPAPAVMLEELLAARREVGLGPLEPQVDLIETARRQALYIAQIGQRTHLSGDGNDPRIRAGQVGYQGRLLGEVLAESSAGDDTPLAAWMSHAPSRDVLLNPSATSIGVFVASGKDRRRWWVVLMGAPDRV